MADFSSIVSTPQRQSTITDHFQTLQGQCDANRPPYPKRPKSSGLSPALEKAKKENITPVTEATMLEFGWQDSSPDLKRPTTSHTKQPSVPQPAPVFLELQEPSPKKLQVKNLRSWNEKRSLGFANATWKSLGLALQAIYDFEKIPMSMEELYRGVEYACRAGGAPELYKQLRLSCGNHILLTLKPKVIQSATDTNVDVARQINAIWVQWQKQLVSICFPRRLAFYSDC